MCPVRGAGVKAEAHVTAGSTKVDTTCGAATAGGVVTNDQDEDSC